MLTPSGQPGHKIEKVMLLTLWANALKEEMTLDGSINKKKLLFAGIGKPTYPINQHTIQSYLSYWQRLDSITKEWYKNPAGIVENTAIEYGDPRGDYEPRALMAKIMSYWYQTEIKPDNVLFTVGGIGGLRVIFETLNTHFEDIPGYRVISPFPHYSAYSNNPLHCLHPIDVMTEPGYKLTAKALEASIKEAYALAETDHGLPKVVLICNPSNPLGNIIDAEEIFKISEILRGYPDLYIVFDEAYAEMSYVEMPSFLKIAPDLKDRVIIMRSATKALSAAGDRMAVLLVFEQALMNEMLNKNISYFIHAPRSAQLAYAETMAKFDETERKKICFFYKKKVDYVIERLKAMGAAMPDPFYNVEATFYALGNFKDLFGLELPDEVRRVLQRAGKISTDEDLAYYLLFNDSLMIAPLSYFGLAKDSGYIRITCSGDDQELTEIMDRLEFRLFEARQLKKIALLEIVTQKISELKKVYPHMHEIVSQKIAILNNQEDTCLTLKAKNHVLNTLQSSLESYLGLLGEISQAT